MQLDEQLFVDHEQKRIPSTLRIYSWSSDCLTYGYSQQIEKELDMTRLPDRAIIARRPTGGGIVFHTPGDLTYCLVADKQLFPVSIEESCAMIHRLIAATLAEFAIQCQIAKSTLSSNNGRDVFEKVCFATPSRYELVTMAGKKLAGSAQRRGKRTLLQQGTIPLLRPSESWKSLLFNPEVYDKLEKKSIWLNALTPHDVAYETVAEKLMARFKLEFEQ